MILSFAETTPALLAGAKTVTRREWADSHARKFTVGMPVQAWDKTPRVKGAKRVGTVKITQSPFQQWSCQAPESDWDAEGFQYLTDNGLTLFKGQTPRQVWNLWTANHMGEGDEPEPHKYCALLWVVRFEWMGATP